MIADELFSEESKGYDELNKVTYSVVEDRLRGLLRSNDLHEMRSWTELVNFLKGSSFGIGNLAADKEDPRPIRLEEGHVYVVGEYHDASPFSDIGEAFRGTQVRILYEERDLLERGGTGAGPDMKELQALFAMAKIASSLEANEPDVAGMYLRVLRTLGSVQEVDGLEPVVDKLDEAYRRLVVSTCDYLRENIHTIFVNDETARRKLQGLAESPSKAWDERADIVFDLRDLFMADRVREQDRPPLDSILPTTLLVGAAHVPGVTRYLERLRAEESGPQTSGIHVVHSYESWAAMTESLAPQGAGQSEDAKRQKASPLPLDSILPRLRMDAT